MGRIYCALDIRGLLHRAIVVSLASSSGLSPLVLNSFRTILGTFSPSFSTRRLRVRTPCFYRSRGSGVRRVRGRAKAEGEIYIRLRVEYVARAISSWVAGEDVGGSVTMAPTPRSSKQEAWFKLRDLFFGFLFIVLGRVLPISHISSLRDRRRVSGCSNIVLFNRCQPTLLQQFPDLVY